MRERLQPTTAREAAAYQIYVMRQANRGRHSRHSQSRAPTPQTSLSHEMAARNPPPWLTDRVRQNQRPPPPSTIPAKRSANTRTSENPSKRSTNAQEEAWVADEDRFVLQQSKTKAALRVKGGRAKPIDWLAVTLRFIDPTKTLADDEVEDNELDVVDPEGVFEGLSEEDLRELEKDIDTYLTLETNRGNREYWNVGFPLG
jgi:hypothetical protein